MSKKTRIAFIGAGNMATALARGLQRSDSKIDWSIAATDPDDSQRARFTASVSGASVSANAAEALCGADVVIWAVKPQVLPAVAAEHASKTRDALHLSIAAGVRLLDLARWFGSSRIVRAMPNTPALVGAGICGLLAGAAVTDEDRIQVENILEPTGEIFWVSSDEAMDAVTAITGSGPAYVHHFMESLSEAAVQSGFEPELARRMVLATVLGTARLAQDQPVAFGVLRQQVTSRGGTTAAALDVLDARGTRDAVMAAARAALVRARELGAELS
ncbi:pyrroline-5-carboxylate reductase [Hydrogenophaga sp.]|jgi:pyrroline-5-carboxylate reductase|uniref:pyrroline-5-carboxylate reductase n=1 Tax=Hydrogenophaga sp. TaxID=1904254 RepID=UPI003F6F84DD